MCGISVYFNKDFISQEKFVQFEKSMQIIDHRGPDDEGIILINTKNGNYKTVATKKTHTEISNTTSIDSINLNEYNLILGHKRLSIIDLSVLGHQPMQGKDNSWIVFNGEIYNYIEVRQELISLGCEFKTNSDTEVVLEAYRIWGKDCLNKFNGMWTIILWDANGQNLFLSNDRFGVKPLYYKEFENEFLLFSEIKQVKAFSKNISINKDHLKEFIDYGYQETDEHTIFNNVYRFNKSHFLLLDLKNYAKSDIRSKQIRYYNPSYTSLKIDFEEAKEQFRDLLHDAVKLRMRADVDFGFALSGGIDSSAVLYAARNINNESSFKHELLGFSAVFLGHDAFDESKFVKIVADDLPCKTFYANPIDDFAGDVFEKHIYHQDEPMPGTSYFAQWSVYDTAQKQGMKILFNGQGADEVFAGYHHHFYKYCRELLMKGLVPKYLSLVNQFAEIKGIDKKRIHKIVMNEMKLATKMKLGIAKFDHALVKHWNKIDKLDEMLKRDFDTYQLPMYLKADDRDSMAFSIESRHPFMDYRLVEFGYSLPKDFLIRNGWQKSLIREAMHEMPNEIRFRTDKKGFVTPENYWLENYKELFNSYLKYNNEFIGTEMPSKHTFYNYSIGAWLKVNAQEII